jgi:LAO/AO transport system kinase
LILPGAGDELQGIKRGIIEMVDAIAVNKADGDLQGHAERARAEYQAALRLFPTPADGWAAPVVTCSALTGGGIAAIWEVVLAHRVHLEANGQLAIRRQQQALSWMRDLVAAGLDAALRADPVVAAALPALEAAVSEGRTTPVAASREVLARFRR